MIFSSPEFIFLLLPIAFFGYFFLNRMRLLLAAKMWLVAVSLFFYAYWNLAYLPLLLLSIVFNFGIGMQVSPVIGHAQKVRYYVLICGIMFNLMGLGYFKYTNFLIDNANLIFHENYLIPQIILPLGISFFTFTQIAYLVDSYRGEAKEYNFINYALFVTFFPHLIAGPILHHREMMPQFESRWTLAIRYRYIFLGLFIFSLGLFKKVLLADSFATWANKGFEHPATLDFFSAWASSLSYTFQLYFDFSGYCDMAMGAALLFNIWLPLNFNSPYKALDIQDFWRRWHITLSRYLRDYLYIPLGGNRCSTKRSYFNLMATFVLGGLWHGASWMFIIWGTLHGLALVIHRAWRHAGLQLPKMLAWFITFNFINVTWVFFRAKTLDDALFIIRNMFDIRSGFFASTPFIPTENLAWAGWFADDLLHYLPTGIAINFLCFLMIVIGFLLIIQKNSFELMRQKPHHLSKLLGALLLFCSALYTLLVSSSTVFLYFNF